MHCFLSPNLFLIRFSQHYEHRTHTNARTQMIYQNLKTKYEKFCTHVALIISYWHVHSHNMQNMKKDNFFFPSRLRQVTKHRLLQTKLVKTAISPPLELRTLERVERNKLNIDCIKEQCRSSS